MDLSSKKNYINLENLVNFSRGDDSRILKYLRQFKELIPERIEQLQQALKNEDRVLVRQLLHKMSPQLQFFGIQNISIPIQRLEFEYEVMPLSELNKNINNIILILNGAIVEVNKTLENQIE